jgi:hypothetical protein
MDAAIGTSSPQISIPGLQSNSTPFVGSITLFGVFILSLYGVIKTAEFYGYDQSSYMKYVLFYIFIFISKLILPNYAPKV